ncbi:MAG: LuxR C-terminal-related transcriptional regulator [Actinomycetota bacterium]
MSWSELRAERVLRELRGLTDEPLSPLELLTAAAESFDEAVPSDASCWSTFDPATTMVTSAIGRNIDEQGAAAARFFELEYALDTPGQYGQLASEGRATSLRTIDDLSVTDTGHAAVHEHLVDMGVGQELRVLFQHQDAGWGGVGLMRAPTSAGFSPDELDFATRIAPIVTAAIRGALVRAAFPQVALDLDGGPAVLIVSGDSIVEATPSAVAWLDQLHRGDRGHGEVPTAIRAVAAHATAGRTVAQRARVAASWIVLRGAPLGPDRAVVTVEPAGPPEVTSIIAAALGLTGRELDVVTAVLQGRSTKQIAGDLHLSPYTVQDHLKSVFGKAGVNSRRELVADVFFGVYAPRLGQPVGVDGFFEGSGDSNPPLER